MEHVCFLGDLQKNLALKIMVERIWQPAPGIEPSTSGDKTFAPDGKSLGSGTQSGYKRSGEAPTSSNIANPDLSFFFFWGGGLEHTVIIVVRDSCFVMFVC